METLINSQFADSVITQDAEYVWHPYNRTLGTKKPLWITGASGAYYIGEDGRRYFDAISSWWVNIHGHCHPYISKCIADQMQKLEQIIFTDFTHIGAIELANRLLTLLDIGKGRIFYSDNGSTAVETALKMALQYWQNKIQKGLSSKPKTKVVCFNNAYHGDTFGSMSVSGRSIFNRPFWPYLFEVINITPPYEGKEEISLNHMQKVLKMGDVAAFIFEPIIQGAAGMVPHSAQGLDKLIRLCNEHDVLTIADEVMTGFGRTGPIFAGAQLKNKPDITCLSKGLTGGFLPLGATAVKEFIYEAFQGDTPHSFLHGHSYCGNALACSAALASLDLFKNPICSIARTEIENKHHEFQKAWENHPKIQRCSVTGTILAVEYREQEGKGCNYLSQLRDTLMEHFLSHDILIRPLGNVLYLMPPYCTTSDELQTIYACIEETLENDL